MQHLLERDLRTGKAIFGKDLRQLADALFICSGRAANVEMVSDHHHIAALQCTGSFDVLDVIVIKKLADRTKDLILFAVAGGCAGVGDDGTFTRDERRVLDKAGVRVALICFEHRHIHIALLECFDVGVVLFQGQRIIGFTGIQAAGDSFDHCLAGTPDNNMIELFHSRTSIKY